MKVSEVPQDLDPSYEGLTKLCYAVDDQGQFVTVQSRGWSAEETVKSLAWAKIHKELEAARLLVKAGRQSPLRYFMVARQMDVGLLAQNMGISGLRVRWHLRPNVFARLNMHWISRYADCFEISVQTLREFKGDDGTRF